MNLNKVTIAGNLTRDPEMRYTPKGTAVCKIGVAINRKWKQENGEMKEEVTFVDVDCFGKTAESVAQYFKKGRKIYLDGRLRLESWDDKTSGQKRSKLGVVMESFQFVDSKQSAGDAPPAPVKEKPEASDVPPMESDQSVPF